MKPTREEALKLFKEYNESEGLLKHAMAVEATMVHFAKKFGEDEEKWGVIGLLHDLDYEKYPDEHCVKVVEILEGENYPSDYIRAIASHGYGICSDVEPLEQMEKILYAIDELTGLINASVLVRPSKSIMDFTVKSLNKKWKDKAFAAAIDREVIQRGIDMLGMERNDIMFETIEAMKTAAEDLGLAGEN